MSAYSILEDRFRDLAILGEVSTVLHWDWSVMMPPAAAPARADQLSAMRVLQHQRMTDPAIGDLLGQAAGERKDLDPWQVANLDAMQRSYRRATAVPEKLVAAQQEANSRCETIWRQARADADFDAVAPALADVVALTREEANALGNALDLDPYDALLDGYDPGLRVTDFEDVFEDYAAFLPDALDDILSRQAAGQAPDLPSGPFPDAAQRALVEAMVTAAGFPLGSAGRIDVSAHPFSTGYGGDSRITVGFRPNDPFFAIMSAMHECGHALYELGLPDAWCRQPVGDARGMSMHESQSLIVEMQACRSQAFANWASGLMQTHLGPDPSFAADNLLRILHKVERGFIRIEADEVTYPAHVILRTRLERAMLSGDLAVADLPGAWAEGLQALLGIEPADDGQGCLQDIHWYDGAFGYFPTYTLGAMTAAQLMQSARDAVPDMDDRIARGDFSGLQDWLGPRVHAKASSQSMAEILTEATGRVLDPEAFKRHIRERYGAG